MLYGSMHQLQVFPTWDYQWGYAKFSQSLLSVVPCRNLIENTGFGAEGTHYGPDDKFQLKRYSLTFPLRHPEFVVPDVAFDREYAAEETKGIFGRPPLWRRAVRKARRILSPAVQPA
jgi:hypothetical protein